LIEALLGLGVEHRRVFGPLGNCAWSELAVQGERWRLLRHNSSAPQPPAEAAGPARVAASLEAGATPEEAPALVQDADAVA
jgi:glucosyl-3-phosphoglycerate phosphatase